MNSDKVIRLQTALTALGHEPGMIDGLLGPKTIAAAARFMWLEHGDARVAKAAYEKLRPTVVPDVTISGIDVSAYQGTVDWRKVAGAGYQFAWVKCSEGTTHKNSGRQKRLDGARAFGIPVGGYHYALPKTYRNIGLKDAEREAANFLRCYGTPQPDDLVPALDLESGLIKGAKNHNYNVEWTLRWCEIIKKELGCSPIIYTARWATQSRIIKADKALLDELKTYRLWWAEYRSESTKEPRKNMFPWTTWDAWQWTGSGKVPGVKGGCDVNRMRASSLEGLKIS
ncbi:MAG: hypothetical protein CMM54_00520 [Rhodospirillaceae bacterium]|nr:hypothetical protein [Rhodospirillaceae bacterium]